MIVKGFIYMIFGVSSLTMISQSKFAVMRWGDLGIGEQLSLIGGFFLIAVGIITGAITFTNIWVRDGYAGEDKILIDREVALYISHVLAFMSFIFFMFLALTHKYNDYPMIVYYIDASVFISPGAIKVIQNVMDKFKGKSVGEGHSNVS